MDEITFKEIDSEPRETLVDRLRDAIGDDIKDDEVCPKCGSSDKEYWGYVFYRECWGCKKCGWAYPTKAQLDMEKRLGWN